MHFACIHCDVHSEGPHGIDIRPMILQISAIKASWWRGISLPERNCRLFENLQACGFDTRQLRHCTPALYDLSSYYLPARDVHPNRLLGCPADPDACSNANFVDQLYT
jgi:hypothetical protein